MQCFADLIADVIEFRVLVSDPKLIPGEGSEVDVEFDVCHKGCQLMVQRFADGINTWKRESEGIVAAYHLYHLVLNGLAGVDDAKAGRGGLEGFYHGDVFREGDGVQLLT